MTRKHKKADELYAPVEGPIVEWTQDQWWLDGKTRIKEKNSFFQKKKVKIIILGLTFFILAIGLLMVQMRKPPSVNKNEETVPDSTQEKELSSLQQQIVKLRSQLKQSDPANRETPLPVVEMNIIIEMD